MKRLELFEFEDFDWLPNVIRNGVTNLIVVLHKILGTSEVIASLVGLAQSKYRFSQIVDLGAGSGGAMPEVIKLLNQANTSAPMNLILTDLHPNKDWIREVEKRQLENIIYQKESVDATNIETTPEGLKTMINSFHHMSPQIAKKIMKSARDNKQPLLVYEMGENFVPTFLWWLLLPLSLCILFTMVLFMTPFVRPLGWKQLLFTYLIPIIPIVYAWDGQASTMRTYTFQDIEDLLADIKSDDYT